MKNISTSRVIELGWSFCFELFAFENAVINEMSRVHSRNEELIVYIFFVLKLQLHVFDFFLKIFIISLFLGYLSLKKKYFLQILYFALFVFNASFNLFNIAPVELNFIWSRFFNMANRILISLSYLKLFLIELLNMILYVLFPGSLQFFLLSNSLF